MIIIIINVKCKLISLELNSCCAVFKSSIKIMHCEGISHCSHALTANEMK